MGYNNIWVSQDTKININTFIVYRLLFIMNFDNIIDFFNLIKEHNPIAIFIKSTEYIVRLWVTGNMINRGSVIIGFLLVLFLCTQTIVPIIEENFPPEQKFPWYVFSMILLLIIILSFLLLVLIGIWDSYETLSWYGLARKITLAVISILLVLFVIWLGINLLSKVPKVLGFSSSIDDDIVFVEKEIYFGTSGKKDFLIAENVNCSNYKNDRESSRLLNSLKDSYDNYLDLCPNDPEIQIYLNNIDAGKNKDYIAIAVAVPISGEEEARDSQEILRGVALAQNKWNRDENNQDLQVAIAIADYGNQNSQKEIKSAEKITTSLASQKEILGVIGHFSTEITEYIAPIYQKNKLLLISASSATKRKNTDVNQSDVAQSNNEKCLSSKKRSWACLNSYIFRTSLSDVVQLKNLVDTVDSKHKIAFIYEEDSTYSRSYILTLKTLISQENIIEINSDACNFSKYGSRGKPKLCLRKIEELDTNITKLLLVPTSKNKKSFDKLIKENDSSSNKLRLLGSDSIYTEEFVKNGDKSPREDTTGMLVFVPWHRSNTLCQEGANRLECKAAKLFSNRSSADQKKQEYEPFKISWRTATAYDATLAMLNGLRISNEQCNVPMINKPGFDINRCMRNNLKGMLLSEDFKTKMSKDSKAGALGSIVFDENGDRESEGKSGVVVEVKNGNFEIYNSSTTK